LLAIIFSVRAEVNPFPQIDIPALVTDGKVQRQMPVAKDVVVVVLFLLLAFTPGKEVFPFLAPEFFFRFLITDPALS
jgi:hypothetical protein